MGLQRAPNFTSHFEHLKLFAKRPRRILAYWVNRNNNNNNRKTQYCYHELGAISVDKRHAPLHSERGLQVNDPETSNLAYFRGSIHVFIRAIICK